MVRKTLTANEIFRRRFKGKKNFMTPSVDRKGKINKNVAFELSSGKSILGDGRTFGVTVVASGKGGKTRTLSASRSFSNKNEAEAHINRLKRKFIIRRKRIIRRNK